MKRPSVVQLVLIVSCAHLMVHTYELALPSVEQLVASDYAVNKATMGQLSTVWRLPFGLGALLAGWLVDRYGSRRMLACYLIGCASLFVVASFQPQLSLLFVSMFGMGLFASIYHPAGLALISHGTTPEQIPRALGIHGIFGSAGIGGAPFLAGIVLSFHADWTTYFQILAIPGILLGFYFATQSALDQSEASEDRTEDRASHDADADWPSYFALTGIVMLLGFTYSAIMSFLPRYLDGADIVVMGVPRESTRNYMAGGVLFVGCIGQYVSGRIARTDRLERQLATISLVSVPCLVWMAVASGWARLAATALFSLVHFMHQPISNSLIARYSSRRRRSLAYGLSFAMGFGIGSVGATFAGNTDDFVLHMVLAVVATASGAGAIGISINRRRR